MNDPTAPDLAWQQTHLVHVNNRRVSESPADAEDLCQYASLVGVCSNRPEVSPCDSGLDALTGRCDSLIVSHRDGVNPANNRNTPTHQRQTNSVTGQSVERSYEESAVR